MSTTEDARSLRIALVGLGAMGLPMALNLLAAGHELVLTMVPNGPRVLRVVRGDDGALAGARLR